MGNWLRTIFRAPVFADEAKTRAASLVYGILWSLLGVALLLPLGIFLITPSQAGVTAVASWTAALLIMALLFLVRRGHVQLSGVLLTVVFWAITTFSIVGFRGVRDLTVTGYFLVIILGGLLLGARGSVGFTLLCVLSALSVYLAELNGWISPEIEAEPVLFQLIALVIVMALAAILLRSVVRGIARDADKSRRTAEALAKSSREADATRIALEARSHELEHLTAQLQAAAEVGRAAASILEPEQLLQQVVELIRERFALYHVALCLVGESGEFAEYSAAAGAGAAELLTEGIRFALDDSSMIGWCITHAQMRVAQDVREDPVRLDHPLIPDTRSEATFPLVARGEVLGVLNIQSDEVDAFDADTLAALQLIADQIAVALSNARLFSSSQQALEMMRRAYGDLSGKAWRQLLRQRGEVGYLYARKQVGPVEGDWSPEMSRAAEAAKMAWGEGRRTLAVPLRVRDRVVGAFHLRKEASEAAWTDEEAQLIETLADRLGAALESARLYQDTQDRAAREQLVREITDKMRRAVDMETLFQVTVQELMAALDVPGAFVQLAAPPAEEDEQAGTA